MVYSSVIAMHRKDSWIRHFSDPFGRTHFPPLDLILRVAPVLCSAPLPVLRQPRALVGGHHHLLDPILQGRPLGTHQVVEPQWMMVMQKCAWKSMDVLKAGGEQNNSQNCDGR